MSKNLIFIIYIFLCTNLAIANKSMGLKFADEAAYRSIPLAATPLMGVIPKSIDLTNKFPRPGSQGEQGSCVGWAVAYALKSYQEEVERKWGLNNNQHIFSPAYIYNQIKLSDCQGGSYFNDAFNLLRREGIVSLHHFPYFDTSCNKQPNIRLRQLARHYTIADWRRLNVQDVIELKTQLAAGFPVLAGIVVDREFQELDNVLYQQFSGKSVGGHAIVVIGYSNKRGGFKIINSWGETWGENGYGWISYDAFRQIAREGYVVQDIVTFTPLPVHNVDSSSPSQQPILDTNIFNKLNLTNTARYIGNNIYEWTAYIDGIRSSLDRIDSVTYYLHPTFRDPIRIGSKSQLGHPITTSGWGTFELKAKITLKNGNSHILKHYLKFK